MFFDLMKGLFYAKRSGKGYRAIERKDYKSAFKLLFSAANAGQELPQYHMGLMYLDGLGVEKDLNKAIEWLERSSDQGLDWAQYTLGGIYEKQKNHEKAFQLYLVAAKQENAAAQAKVGGFYYVGLFVEKNRTKAIDWLRRSVENGNENGKRALHIVLNDKTE